MMNTLTLTVPNPKLTWGAHNSSIFIMPTVVNTNSSVAASQQRRFCSSASHIIQKYWTTPLSKWSPRDGNAY